MQYLLAVLFSLPGYALIALSIYIAYGAMLEFVARDRIGFCLAVFLAYLVYNIGNGWNKGVAKALGLD